MRGRLITTLIATLFAACQGPAPASTSPSSPTAGTTVSSGAAPTSGSLPSAPPVRLLVDTDAAPDDLVAISFLVASPNVELAAITVSGTGEVHCPRGAELVLQLLERLAAPDIPVACGDDQPLTLGHAFPDLFRSNADAAAGLDLPTTTRRPVDGGAVKLIASAAAGGGELRILTLGPLTNLAEALGDTAGLSDAIESVYVMGGAVDVPGNIAGSPGGPQDNTTAEWNVYVDPEALEAVLGSVTTTRLVSLDGTNQVPLTAAFAARARASPSGASLRVLAELLAKNEYMTSGSYYLWDAVAAVAAAGYPVGEFTEADLTVDTAEGKTSGATRRGDGPPDAAYMTRADPTLIEDLLISVMDGN
jgi:pyrimidine-specific ribonucleoside hydrolase